MFRTGRNQPIEFDAIPTSLHNFYKAHQQHDRPFHIIIGTDSQNFSDTKVVTVIAMLCEGYGGIFFYEVTRRARIDNVKQKLQTETAESLELANRLLTIFESSPSYEEMFMNCNFAIHVDAGNSDKGKTKMLIPELVGWVKACGYDVQTKPASFVASTIADRLSK